jgi:hypothetical protein
LILFLLLGLAVLAAAVAVALLLLPIVMQHFKGSPGGWTRLASAYATKAPRPERALTGQSIVAGRVLWRFCVSVAVSAAGLYLEIVLPFPLLKRPALLIPWTEFKRLEQGRLFWRKAAHFSLGKPLVGTVTLPMPLYAMTQPFLPPALGKGLPAADRAIDAKSAA